MGRRKAPLNVVDDALRSLAMDLDGVRKQVREMREAYRADVNAAYDRGFTAGFAEGAASFSKRERLNG